MFLNTILNSKNIRLFVVGLLIAFVVLLNFYTLNKIISKSGDDKNIELDYRINN